MTNSELEYLVEEYADHILRLSYSYMKNIHDAQDVMQSVLEKLYVSNPIFKDNVHQKAYILRMTSNACKNMLKSTYRTSTTSLELCVDMVAPEPRENSVLEAVLQLEEKYRLVIYLHYYEGYKGREIAKILGISIPNVHARMVRGREKLKKMLGGTNNGTAMDKGIETGLK